MIERLGWAQGAHTAVYHLVERHDGVTRAACSPRVRTVGEPTDNHPVGAPECSNCQRVRHFQG